MRRILIILAVMLLPVTAAGHQGTGHHPDLNLKVTSATRVGERGHVRVAGVASCPAGESWGVGWNVYEGEKDRHSGVARLSNPVLPITCDGELHEWGPVRSNQVVGGGVQTDGEKIWSGKLQSPAEGAWEHKQPGYRGTVIVGEAQDEPPDEDGGTPPPDEEADALPPGESEPVGDDTCRFHGMRAYGSPEGLEDGDTVTVPNNVAGAVHMNLPADTDLTHVLRFQVGPREDLYAWWEAVPMTVGGNGTWRHVLEFRQETYEGLNRMIFYAHVGGETICFIDFHWWGVEQ